MCKEKSLGEVVRGIPALVNLLDYIEGRAASIFVRERIDGQIGNHALADLPAPLAIHYAFEFIRNCSIPITLAVHSDSHSITETTCDDPDCWCSKDNL